jgi:hypothetical protein
MAISYHEDIEVVAGTAWVIGGVLYHANDQLLDVTNCSLAWSLLNPNGAPVLPVDVNVSISKTDAVNGAISIELAREYTALPPGRYISEGDHAH